MYTYHKYTFLCILHCQGVLRACCQRWELMAGGVASAFVALTHAGWAKPSDLTETEPPGYSLGTQEGLLDPKQPFSWICRLADQRFHLRPLVVRLLVSCCWWGLRAESPLPFLLGWQRAPLGPAWPQKGNAGSSAGSPCCHPKSVYPQETENLPVHSVPLSLKGQRSFSFHSSSFRPQTWKLNGAGPGRQDWLHRRESPCPSASRFPIWSALDPCELWLASLKKENLALAFRLYADPHTLHLSSINTCSWETDGTLLRRRFVPRFFEDCSGFWSQLK